MHNTLSCGVGRGQYFAVKAICVVVSGLAVYLVSVLEYTLLRVLKDGFWSAFDEIPDCGFVTVLLFQLGMGMQVCAYVAVSNLINLCCKKQAMSILLGEVWIFLSIVMRIYAVGEDFYREPGGYHMLRGPVAYEPMYVMECVEYYVSVFDSVFCFGFLKYALSAAVIISVAGIAGYICMIHSDIV